MPLARPPSTSAGREQHQPHDVSDDDADADYIAYLAECRAAQTEIDDMDAAAARGLVSVTSTSRLPSGGMRHSTHSRRALELMQRQQRTFQSFITSAENPVAPPPPPAAKTSRPEVRPSPPAALTNALAAVAAACAVPLTAPLPPDTAPSRIVAAGVAEGISPGALHPLISLATGLRSLRQLIADVDAIGDGVALAEDEDEVDGESDGRDHRVVQRLRVQSLAAIARAAQVVVDDTATWALEAQQAVRNGDRGWFEALVPSPVDAASNGTRNRASSVRAAPRARETRLFGSDPFASDDGDSLEYDAPVSWLPPDDVSPNEPRGRNEGRLSPTPPVPARPTAITVALAAARAIVPRVVLMSDALNRATTEGETRTPPDVLAEAANTARAAGNASADGLLMSVTLLALWPYIDAAIASLFVRRAGHGGDTDGLAGVGGCLPELLPAVLRRGVDDAVGLAAATASRLTPRQVRVAYLRAVAISVQHATPDTAFADENLLKHDTLGSPVAANFAGQYPSAPLPPVRKMTLQLIDRAGRSRRVTDANYVVLSTESLGTGVMLSSEPGDDVPAPVASPSLAAPGADDADDTLSPSRLLSSAKSSAPSSPVRRSAAPVAAPWNDFGELIQDGGESLAHTDHYQATTVSSSMMPDFPPLMRLHSDSATSLPSWVASHFAGPLQRMLSHLQFEEYRAVVSNDDSAASPVSAPSVGDPVGAASGGNPGFFAVLELLDVTALGCDVERMTCGLIDPLLDTTAAWWAATASTGAAALVRGLFTDVLAGIPFARCAQLHVKPSAASEELESLPRHMQMIACFRALRLRLVGVAHAEAAFDARTFLRESGGAAGGGWMTDPRMSAAMSLNVMLSYAVRLLEREWKDSCHRHRRIVSAAGRGSVRIGAGGEVAAIHALRFAIDAIRRFLLHGLRIVAESFKSRCRNEINTVTGLRDAYNDFSGAVGELAFATRDTRGVYRRVEALVVMAFELCSHPTHDMPRAAKEHARRMLLKRVSGAVSSLCGAIGDSPGLAEKAQPLVDALTFNEYFVAQPNHS